MAWEDGTIGYVNSLIDAASNSKSENHKNNMLNLALANARILENEYQRKNCVNLIEDMMKK